MLGKSKKPERVALVPLSHYGPVRRAPAPVNRFAPARPIGPSSVPPAIIPPTALRPPPSHGNLNGYYSVGAVARPASLGRLVQIGDRYIIAADSSLVPCPRGTFPMPREDCHFQQPGESTNAWIDRCCGVPQLPAPGSEEDKNLMSRLRSWFAQMLGR